MRAEVAERAAVRAAAHRLELVDQLHRAQPGRAGDRAGRERGAEQRRVAGAVARPRGDPGDLVDQPGKLGDIAERIVGDRVGLGERSRLARDVDRPAVRRASGIAGVRCGAAAPPGGRPGLDPVADRGEEPLGRRRDQRRAVDLEQRAVRRGRDLGERGVQRERIAGRRDPGGQPAGEAELLDVAGGQVVAGALDPRDVVGIVVAGRGGERGPNDGAKHRRRGLRERVR